MIMLALAIKDKTIMHQATCYLTYWTNMANTNFPYVSSDDEYN
jgi:hypothetical protein